MSFESEILIRKLEENLSRFFRGRGDYQQALEHLTHLGKLRGPVLDSGAEEGMEELVRARRAALIATFVTKTGGAFWYRIAVQALERSADPDAIRALQKLARSGSASERQYAINALRRLGSSPSRELLTFSLLAAVAAMVVLTGWLLYNQGCTPDGFYGFNKCPIVVEPIAVVANTGGQGTIMRKSPTLADRLTSCPDGVLMKIIGADQEKDGVRWRQVQNAAGLRGWVTATTLVDVPTDAQSPPPDLMPQAAPRCLPVPEWAYEGKWFANHRTTAMWNGPRGQADVISFSDTSDKLCVFQERDRRGNSLYVFNPYSENYFWIDEFAVNEVPMPETRPGRTRPPDQNCANAIFVD